MGSKTRWPENGAKFVATTISIDSSAANTFVQTKQVSARTKHNDLKYHFAKAALTKGLFVLHDIPSRTIWQTY